MEKKMSLWERIQARRLTSTFALLATLSVGIVAGSVLTAKVHGKEAQESSDATPLRIPEPQSLGNGFAKIAKMVGPAVVNINTESLPKQAAQRRRRGSGNGSQDQQDMQDFFNRFFGGNPGGGDDEDDDGAGGERRALGSGFIVDSKGYIITNNHVVEKADKIYVKLSTDSESETGRPAKVIGTDKDTDIAVIKIDSATPLPTIKLGNSEGAQVGDWVLAIGSPFGLSQTVSAGIISAKGRQINEPSQSGFAQNQFQRFIQTDAAINPGNSGGPLVDMTGAVVGINTAIYTQSMGSQGVGFAMPANTVVNVYNMLIGPEHKVTRGSIGISFQSNIPSAVARMYGSGVIVSTVSKGGPAEKAGLQPGDVIESIDGRKIKDGDDLVNDIAARRPGSTVKLGYLRDGKAASTTVSIGDRAKIFADLNGNGQDDSQEAQSSDVSADKLGLTVSALPNNVATKLGIKGGVVVSALKPGSFADEIGLGRGQIIVEINRKPVTDMASFQAAIKSLKSGDDVAFLVRTPNSPTGGNNYVGGTLP
ncbi:MAG: Do family serine endopeptidase [Acidobacteria bacterium]|jgi:serine protease Do|nr:Do family serine endopeptidase [Acidobacteriota bacterium]